ncbi:MAG: arylsulfatase [Planctomycetes bacterium]|nr:arylsulfatase [Planctomycetota bacterium]MCB9884167.1 arylsulfatase [Planctomycetota bacterium]
MARLLLLGIAVLLSTAAALAQQAPKKRPPNVVFVMADDLGYGELGCFGQTKIHTPHLDQLAAQGMRLTRYYCGSPVCAPSRCVLMTGKHPGHAAVRDNKEAQPEGQWPLPASEKTLGEVMQAGGYVTGAFGKWGLGPFGSTGDPLHRGFNRFFGYNCQRHAHSYWPEFLYDDAKRIPLANDPPVPGGGKLKPDEDPSDPKSYARFIGKDYAPDRIQAAAVAFLLTNKNRPFFLYLPSVIPHLALHIPDAEAKAYAGQWEEKPYTGGNGYTPHPTPRAAYAAMITRLDREVGQLVDLLDELGLRENTIVVFTSDNGATHSPVGGTDVDFFDSCGGLRGRKGSMYEGGIRVPAIVSWPGVVPKGSASARLVGSEDWLATLTELCGVNNPIDGDGVSFAATLRGEEQAERPFLYREFAGYGGWQAVWVDNLKLVRKNMQKPKFVTELYDLAKDPTEASDLSGARPETVQKLLSIVDREHVPSATFPLKGIDGD